MQSMLSYDLRTIARHNPRLAYILGCVKAPLVPRAYQLGVRFDTGTVNQTLQSYMPVPMSQDAWIWELEYTVRCETAWAGSPLKSQFDYYMTRTPWVDVDISFNGNGPSQDIRVTASFVPLECVAKAAGNPSPYDSVLGNWHVIQKGQYMQMDVNLRRTLGVNELPYSVIVVAKMYEIDGCCVKDIDLGHAMKCLKDIGCLSDHGDERR